MNNKIKILFIAADSSLYGSNKSLLNLLSSINISKSNYLIITPSVGDFNEELDKKQIRNLPILYHWACTKKRQGLRSQLSFLFYHLKTHLINVKAKRIITALIHKEKINIIHTNSGVISIGLEVAKKCRIKHIWHLREFIDLDHQLTPFIGRKRYFKKIKNASFLLCISRSIAQHFSVEGKASVVYNAVAKKSDVLAFVIKETYFLFCGSLTPNKGLDDAIMAFFEVSKINSNIQLKIAGSSTGDDAYYLQIVELIEKYELTDRIEFLGYDKNIKVVMSKAIGLLVCAKNEAMGRVTAEAMLFDCLVIGFNNAGTGELVEDKKTGLLYKTSEEFIFNMKFALQETQSVANIREQARAYAVEHFTEEVFCSYITNMYERVYEMEV